METTEVIYDDLHLRINRLKDIISSAEDSLESKDYIQCAVRLQDAMIETKFDTLHLNIMDSMTDN